jgi:hypothetical protein
MAGITYLYGLWNMNMLGDSPVTMMDAHLDVQACLGTLEALSGKPLQCLWPIAEHSKADLVRS